MDPKARSQEPGDSDKKEILSQERVESLEMIGVIEEREEEEEEHEGRNKNPQLLSIDYPSTSMLKKSDEMFEKNEESSIEHHEEDEKKSIRQFAEAWRVSSGFSILLIDQLSLIVENYFKIAPELAERNQEIETLVDYNTKLLQIFTRFEEQEKTLIKKLQAMEDFNIKCMKELCSIKNRAFRAPEHHEYHSIFTKFSLNDLEFKRKDLPSDASLDNCQQQVKKLIHDCLLGVPAGFKGTVEQKIEEYSSMKSSPTIDNHLQELRTLLAKIKEYERSVGERSEANAFDLYHLKCMIMEQMKSLDLECGQSEGEKSFVLSVRQMMAKMKSMDEAVLQEFLKNEKSVQKKLRKLRVKEQESFVRKSDRLETENLDLKKDLAEYKKLCQELEEKLKRLNVEKEFKSMKRFNKSSQNMDESVLGGDEMKSSRKLLKETMRKMTEELNDLKMKLQEYEKEREEREILDKKRKSYLRDVRAKLTNMSINLPRDVEELALIEILVEKITSLSDELCDNKDRDKDDSLVSPHLDQIGYGFTAANNENFLRTIPEKMEMDEHVELKIKELGDENNQLKRKVGDMNKEITEKDVLIKKHEKIIEENQEKINKVNMLVAEYEGYRGAIKDMKEKMSSLSRRSQIAEILGKNVIGTISKLRHTEINYENFLKIMEQVLERLYFFKAEYDEELKRNSLDFKTPTLSLTEKDFSRMSIESSKNSKKESDRVSASQRIDSVEKKSPLRLKKIQSLSGFEQIQQRGSLSNKGGPLEAEQIRLKGKKTESFEEQQPYTNVMKEDPKPNFQRRSVKSEDAGSFHSSEKANSKRESMKQSRFGKSEGSSEKNKVEEGSNEGNRLQIESKSSKGYQGNKQEKNEGSEQSKGGVEKSGTDFLSFLNDNKDSEKGMEELIGDKGKKAGKIPQRGNRFSDSPNTSNNNFKKFKNSQSLNNSKGEIFEIPIEAAIPDQSSIMSLPKIRILGADNKEVQVVEEGKGKERKEQKKDNKRKQEKKDRKEDKKQQKKESSRDKSSSLSNLYDREEGSNNFMEQFDLVLSNKVEESEMGKGMEDGRRQQISFELSKYSEVKKSEMKEAEEEESRSMESLGRLDLKFVYEIYEKIERLKYDENTLDFYELFQRYKQALACLEKQEKINKQYEIKYQKFMDDLLIHKQERTPFKLQEQVYFLKKKVIEQEERIKEQDLQIQVTMKKQIEESQKAIKEHLKVLRAQSNLQQKRNH